MSLPDNNPLLTTCPMDCPDTCTLSITVEDDKIVRVKAADQEGLTAGFICGKIRNVAKRVYGPDRVGTPRKRIGAKGDGRFVDITWDEALTEITDRFKSITAQWGGEAILPFNYGGSNGFLTDGFVDDQYFAKLGASRLLKTVCATPSSEAAAGMYGKMPGVAFEDIVNAKCIVVWGANPKASNIHLVPILKEARSNGAFVAVIDPVNNFSESEIDLHLAVKPGTDLPIALAMIEYWNASAMLDYDFIDAHTKNVDRLLDCAAKWSLDQAAAIAGVSMADIRRLADMMAKAEPSVVRAGWGIERNQNGGQAYAAILAMPALLGKFGVAGGGFAGSNSAAVTLDRTTLRNGVEWKTRELNMSRLGRLLVDVDGPPIKGLFVYNCNPVATMPNQNAVIAGLQRDDLFTVVFDEVMTDTAAYADIVLPATTFLEESDIRKSYGRYVVGGVLPVIPPVGEARSNPAVFSALARAMGWDETPFNCTADEQFEMVAGAIGIHSRSLSSGELKTGEAITHEFPGETPVQFDTVSPRTDDGLVDFCPPQLGGAPYVFKEVVDLRYPLALISPALAGLISSTFGESNYKELRLTMNPLDATSRSIEDGDEVTVANELGEVVCLALVSDSVRDGTVVLPKGAWRKSSLNGKTSNALCPDTVNVVGGGACFNDARVEVRKQVSE